MIIKLEKEVNPTDGPWMERIKGTWINKEYLEMVKKTKSVLIASEMADSDKGIINWSSGARGEQINDVLVRLCGI